MTSGPSAAGVRASALALLASGNSPDSVAHVLGVPVETLQSWAAQATQPLPAPPAAAPGRAAAWTTFPKTATYAMGQMGRHAGFAFVPLLLVGPVFACPFVFDGSSTGSGIFMLLVATLACLAAAASMVRYVTHARFELQPSAITAYKLGDGVSLPLARIEALTATRQPRSTSYTVVLHATGGAPSLKIHPEERHLRDDDLFAWLTSIPRRGGRSIGRKDVDDSSIGSLGMRIVVGVITLAGLGLLAIGPIDAARSIVEGYPPLARLSLTEGTLTGMDGCRAGGRGHANDLPITLAGDGGTVYESVDCKLAPALRARDGDHHVSIWRDKRRFADGTVREVDLDGRVLQSYAEFVARNRRFAPFNLLGQLMLLSTFVLLGVGFVVSNRADRDAR